MPAGEGLEVDPVADAAEAQLDAVVDEALGTQALAHAGLHEQLRGVVLEHPGADPVLHVVAAARLEDHALDPLELEQPAEREPGRTGPDDGDLRALLRRHGATLPE